MERRPSCCGVEARLRSDGRCCARRCKIWSLRRRNANLAASTHDGGPGNLTAKKAFLAVEAVIGRPLTKDECTSVREELPVLTMQVTPASQIGSRCLYLGTYYGSAR